MTSPHEIEMVHTPTLNLSDLPNDEHRGLTLALILNDHDLSNTLVITFAKKGPIACPEMLGESSTTKLLYELEQRGQEVHEPSLLAIVDDHGHSRRVFVTPCPEETFRGFAVWVSMILDTVDQLKSRDIAIYPCPGALSDEKIFELLGQLIRALVAANTCDRIGVVVGRFDYNRMLNTLLDLKNELKSREHPILVVH